MDRLPPNQTWVAPGRWPILGERAALPTVEPWTISLDGLCATPKVWSLADLQSRPQIEVVLDIHCVTRWSKPDVSFSGVRLSDLLDESGVEADCRFVSFVAHTERSHSSSLSIEDVRTLDPLIAFKAEGEPLPAQHGGPVRLVVPGRYFYKSVKWLRNIQLLADDRLGYWEADAGYHNHADPWKEERYVASQLDRREVAELIATRDLSGRELLNLSLRGHELQALQARDAILRHADFRSANLAAAVFDGANLSNADFRDATLRDACFSGTDLEGADFRNADLRGATFENASLFGATLAPSQIDSSTQFDAATLETLASLPGEAAFVTSALNSA